MSRPALVCFGLAALGLLGLAVLARSGGVLPSWLAFWLLVLALPLGALPLVLGAAWFGATDRPELRALRGLLPVMPVAALLGAPILLHRASLYPAARPAGVAAAAVWMSPSMVVTRAIMLLVLWTAMSLWSWSAAGSSPWARRLAPLGLALHLVMVTIAAGDWIGALDPGLNASSLGVLMLLAQCGLAYAAACLLAAAAGARLPPGDGIVLAVLAGLWLFVHFTHYLIVWSANLPEEIGWYVQRQDGLGGLTAGLAVLVALLAVASGLFRAGPRFLILVAALLAGVHAVEWFWLVAPTIRNGFTVTGADGLGLVAAAGLAGCIGLWGPARTSSGGAQNGTL